jgi:hypothetical protein
MQEFKIKVNQQTSEEIQNCIFNLGYSWSSGKRVIRKGVRYIEFEHELLSYYMTEDCFQDSYLQEITIEEFRALYSQETCHCVMECMSDSPFGETICRHRKEHPSKICDCKGQFENCPFMDVCKERNLSMSQIMLNQIDEFSKKV